MDRWSCICGRMELCRPQAVSIGVGGRALRAMVDKVLKQLSRRFDAMYSSTGRLSIPPAQLLRAQLLQMLYSIRSERLLMEEIDYSVLFRWFIGLNLDDEV
jgi:transposase